MRSPIKKNLVYFYAALIILFYGFGLTKHTIRHENKITSLFYFGSNFAFPDIIETQGIYIFQDSDGYDGQFYLLVAMDPFFSRGFSDFVDNPGYRYTRILLPFMSYLLTFRQPSLIPYTYILINLAGLVLGCYYFIRIIRFYNAGDFYVLVYAISLGMYIAMKRMLPDAFSINLMVIAIYYYLVGHNRRFLIFITLSVLAKETMVLVPISFFLSAVWREKKIGAASLAHLIPSVVLLVWVVILHLELNSVPPATNMENLTMPFLGMARRVGLLINVFPKGWIDLMNILVIACLAIYFLLSLVRRRDPLQVSFAAYGLLISCLHHDIVLIDIHAYGRIIQPLVVFSLIESLRDRRNVMKLPAFLIFLEAFHMLFGGKFHP